MAFVVRGSFSPLVAANKAVFVSYLQQRDKQPECVQLETDPEGEELMKRLAIPTMLLGGGIASILMVR
jgi:hypothetical protein